MPAGVERAQMTRNSPLEMSPDDFRALGHKLVDQVADFLASLPARRVTSGESPGEIRAVLGDERLPEQGAPPEALLREADQSGIAVVAVSEAAS